MDRIIERLNKEFPNKKFYKREINDLCSHYYLDNDKVGEYISLNQMSRRFFTKEQIDRMEEENLKKIIEEVKSLDKN